MTRKNTRKITRALMFLFIVVFITRTAVTPLLAGKIQNNVVETHLYNGRYQDVMTNYVFKTDADALGKWETVGTVKKIELFTPNSSKYKGMCVARTFLPNGIAMTYYNKPNTVKNENIFQWTVGWTKGYIMGGTSSHMLNNEQTGNTPYVSKYVIKLIDGNYYMFVENKELGEYSKRGQVDNYFVLRKTHNLNGDSKLLKQVELAKNAVEEEYTEYSNVPSNERRIETGQKIPYKMMFLVYTNGWHDGKQYTMSDSTIKGLKKGIVDLESLIEKLTQNNVDVIIDYTLIDRKVSATNEQTNENTIGISPATAKPDMEKYAPIGEYNFIYAVSSIPNPVTGANYQRIYAEQGFSSSDISYITENNTGSIEKHFMHEMLHAFEFRAAQPISIEMPLEHLSCCEFPVGYDNYIPGHSWETEMTEENKMFLTADIKYTDPVTKKISYVGVYPSIFRYVIAWHNYLASVKYEVITPPTPSPNLNVPVTGITLSTKNITVKVGATKKIHTNVLPNNATNQKVKWKSSNQTVATVSSTGLVKGLKGGTVTITASTIDGAKKAICTVVIK
ncbi:MAG: hypothetical protein K0R05_4459 [Anaerocolumna sp.]|jgi:hypothetical protein|nr:hypothetical protein [Anaerocolumna sp.]